jgi:hypothetical protein
MFIDQKIWTAHPVLKLLNLGNQSLVMQDKWEPTVPVARHTALPDQQFARELGVPVVDEAGLIALVGG